MTYANTRSWKELKVNRFSLQLQETWWDLYFYIDWQIRRMCFEEPSYEMGLRTCFFGGMQLLRRLKCSLELVPSDSLLKSIILQDTTARPQGWVCGIDPLVYRSPQLTVPPENHLVTQLRALRCSRNMRWLLPFSAHIFSCFPLLTCLFNGTCIGNKTSHHSKGGV